MTPHDLLTPGETAKRLRLSKGTLANWRARKDNPLPFVKLGRLVRYRRTDVERFGGLTDSTSALAGLPAGRPGTGSGRQVTQTLPGR